MSCRCIAMYGSNRLNCPDYNHCTRMKKQTSEPTTQDSVNHPPHYNAHPSGIECIVVTEHMNFCRGNAIKYIWRAGAKDKASEIEDLKKAQWYLAREIKRLEDGEK